MKKLFILILILISSLSADNYCNCTAEQTVEWESFSINGNGNPNTLVFEPQSCYRMDPKCKEGEPKQDYCLMSFIAKKKKCIDPAPPPACTEPEVIEPACPEGATCTGWNPITDTSNTTCISDINMTSTKDTYHSACINYERCVITLINQDDNTTDDSSSDDSSSDDSSSDDSSSDDSSSDDSSSDDSSSDDSSSDDSSSDDSSSDDSSSDDSSSDDSNSTNDNDDSSGENNNCKLTNAWNCEFCICPRGTAIFHSPFIKNNGIFSQGCGSSAYATYCETQNNSDSNCDKSLLMAHEHYTGIECTKNCDNYYGYNAIGDCVKTNNNDDNNNDDNNNDDNNNDDNSKNLDNQILNSLDNIRNNTKNTNNKLSAILNGIKSAKNTIDNSILRQTSTLSQKLDAINVTNKKTNENLAFRLSRIEVVTENGMIDLSSKLSDIKDIFSNTEGIPGEDSYPDSDIGTVETMDNFKEDIVSSTNSMQSALNGYISSFVGTAPTVVGSGTHVFTASVFDGSVSFDLSLFAQMRQYFDILWTLLLAYLNFKIYSVIIRDLLKKI